MDRCAVTNAEFRRFVDATGHVTVAERPPDPADYPGADPELLVPASAVFRKPRHRVDLRNPYDWWINAPGASWRHPRRVMKGGLGGGGDLCAPNYCRRYRPAARMAQAVDTSMSHLGFRCVVRV